MSDIYYGEDNERFVATGEKLQYILDAQQSSLEIEKVVAEQLANQKTIKDSAYAKLAALGLTDDEINAVFGI